MSSEQHATAPFTVSFDRDLENARVLIEESPWKENPQKYRKVAEGIVRRVLTFDPSNEYAKRLLDKIETPVPAPVPVAAPAPVAVPVAAPEPVASPAPVPVPPPKPQPVPVLVQASTPVPVVAAPTPVVPAPTKVVELSMPEPAPPPPRRPTAQAQMDLSFVADPRPAAKPEISKRAPWALISVAAIGAIAGVTLLVTHRSTFSPEYPPKSAVTAPRVVQASTTVPPEPVAPVASVVETEQPAALPAPPPEPPPKPEPVAVQPSVVVKSNVAPVAPLETGTLAVSSPTTVDIYLNDQLVGSAPTTLVLPVGNQTLEYRHQDMRKVVSHTIRTNETTTAMITFDVTVQINAKPWAQVFIDGTKRQPLGQTPLSDVRVPIGSNLVFENPNFQGKTYRITGKETQIRVSFP